MNDDRLLEPVKAYNEFYEREFDANARDYFNDLVEKSGIDVEQNRDTVKKYRAATTMANETARKLSKRKTLRGFLIALTVLGFLAAAIGVFMIVQNTTVAGAVTLSVGAVVAIGALLLILIVLNKQIKQADALFAKRSAEAESILREAWRQMQPLNALFDSDATKKLIEKTIPLLKIDDNFSMRRYDYLNGKYGFGDNDDVNRSTIAVLTGEILGNPFVVDREIVESTSNFTYTGTLVIHWTTTYRDSQGHVHTQHHSQTLTASVTKPKPVYSQQTRLIYGNEAAPDLRFAHEPTHAERLSEKALASKVKSETKKIKKLQTRALDSAQSNFTVMGNEEFDALFNAFDRNNEVQFRLMFTPLAQKNMLDLMKDKAHYGDDFTFIKSGCLNYVSSEHSASWDMNADHKRYFSYGVDEALNNFLSFNNAYFRSLYFDFAPLLSVPLYQQHKPKEYIYRDNYPRNLSSYEAEVAVNALGDRAFADEYADTPSILKTGLLYKEGKSDAVGVTAYAYHIEPRVDYVPVFGGDGCVHSVPVPWDEYIPVQRESVVKLKELPFSDKQFYYGEDKTGLHDALSALGTTSFGRGILCCLVNDINASFDAEIDKKLK
ncbi:MAG: hypothetical protein K2J61_03255 [Clostridia bacterium]|nr:hypothetical protein [Clostridia bacterium]